MSNQKLVLYEKSQGSKGRPALHKGTIGVPNSLRNDIVKGCQEYSKNYLVRLRYPFCSRNSGLAERVHDGAASKQTLVALVRRPAVGTVHAQF